MFRYIIRLIWNCIPNSVWSIPSKCMQIVTDWNWLLQFYNCDLWSDNCMWIFNCTFDIYSDGWFVLFIQTNVDFFVDTFLAHKEKESKLKCMDVFYQFHANNRCFTLLKSWETIIILHGKCVNIQNWAEKMHSNEKKFRRHQNNFPKKKKHVSHVLKICF